MIFLDTDAESIRLSLPIDNKSLSGDLELLFDYTNTSFVTPHPDEESTAQPYVTDGTRVIIPESSVTDEITIRYTGQHPRLLAVTKRQDSVLNDVKHKWMACRFRKALSDPIQRYFTLLDLVFSPHAVRDWKPDNFARAGLSDHERIEIEKKILNRLPGNLNWLYTQEFCTLSTDINTRFLQRSQPRTVVHNVNKTHYKQIVAITDLFRNALPDGAISDPRKLDHIHVGFAAGKHRQDCPFVIPDGVVMNKPITTDADSAAVLLFAECALAIIEVGRDTSPAGDPHRQQRLVEASEFWWLLLNSMTQMQSVYIARFGDTTPRCFNDYHTPDTPLHDTDTVTKDIAALRDQDEHEHFIGLKKIMASNAQRVVPQDGSCIPNTIQCSY